MDKIIQILKYILIGIIQGVCEILPISSSGHLSLAYYYLNIDETIQLDLTIFLHLASSVALLIYYRKHLSTLIKSTYLFIFKKKNEHKNSFLTILYLLIAMIPIAVVGYFIKPIIEKSFSDIYIVLLGFLLSSIMMLIINLFNKSNKQLSFIKSFLIGIFQCLAIFPGVSRSGTCLTISKALKTKDNEGKNFCFLLLLPISLGSTILSLFDLNINSLNIHLNIISMIIAFILTLLSLKLIFHKRKSIPYYVYSIYLILLVIINLIMIK